MDFSWRSYFTPWEEDAVPSNAQTNDASNSLGVEQGYDMVCNKLTWTCGKNMNNFSINWN